MCDDETKDILNNILYAIETEKYEPGGYFTIGGGNGTYSVKSPWNTECEVGMFTISTSSATSIPYAISTSNPSLTTPSATASSYGALATGGEGNALEGIAGFVAVNAVSYLNNWLPLGRNGYVYFACTPGASNIATVTLAFRRIYSHLIPYRPDQRPATYNRPASRRGIRAVDHFSKQVSGFVAQYPEREGGKESYTHVEVPWSQNTRGAYRSGRTRKQQ